MARKYKPQLPEMEIRTHARHHVDTTVHRHKGKHGLVQKYT